MSQLYTKDEVLRLPLSQYTRSRPAEDFSTPGLYLTHPASVNPWPNFDEFVTSTLEAASSSDSQTVQNARQHRQPPDLSMLDCNSEAPLNALFITQTAAVINDIGAKDGSGVRLELSPQCNHSHGAPDVSGSAGDEDVVIGEGKDISVLHEALDGNLATIWQEAHTDVDPGRKALVGNVVDCIAQLHGYLCAASLTYGFLTTYRSTWVVKREPDDKLLCSDALHFTGLVPPVLAAIYSIMWRGKTVAKLPPPQKPALRPDGVANRSPCPSAASQDSSSSANTSESPRRVTSDTCKYSRCVVEEARLFRPEELALGRLLGQGATGPVFEARLQLPEGECAAAIKAVDVTKRLEVVADLVWEAEVLQQLAAATCVPKFLAQGSMTGGLCFFLASSLLSGVRPSAELTQTGLLDSAHAGLSEIHAAGIVHNDLRLENMMVVSPSLGSNRVMFLDFGRAIKLPSTRSCHAQQQFAAEHEELDALLAA